MRRLILLAYVFTFSTLLTAQNKRLWVLRTPGQAVEYDTTTLAEKQKVEVPPEAVASPLRFSVNALGQMLFALPVALPLADGSLSPERKVWVWMVTRQASFRGTSPVLLLRRDQTFLSARPLPCPFSRPMARISIIGFRTRRAVCSATVSISRAKRLG
jgi:hypothetical protein